MLSKSSQPIFKDRPAQKKESLTLIFICVYFVAFISFYHERLPMDSLLVSSNEWVKEVVVDSFKFLFIVIIPVIIYYFVYGFQLKDWGISLGPKSYTSKKSLVIFILFFLVVTLFQYFLGNGAKPIREGMFSPKQLTIALPLCFLWLIISVGIVEEYFFRFLLQSRISVVVNSQIGGIILSSVIFGLAHAPGIYLRGGGIIANIGPNPSLLLAFAYSFLMLSVAGFFLSILWVNTKNFWLIVGVHASVDLLPSLPKFITAVGI